MSRKKHVVDLSDAERSELEEFVSKGEHKAEDITRDDDVDIHAP